MVKFFEYALQIEIETAVDLPYLGPGTLLVSGALWLSHGKEGTHPHVQADDTAA